MGRGCCQSTAKHERMIDDRCSETHGPKHNKAKAKRAETQCRRMMMMVEDAVDE